jgi:putative transposase
VHIPHAKFLELLTYKAEALGIRVIVTEESYTSQASFLDLDVLLNYDPTQGAEQEEKLRFSGNRIWVTARVMVCWRFCLRLRFFFSSSEAF